MHLVVHISVPCHPLTLMYNRLSLWISNFISNHYGNVRGMLLLFIKKEREELKHHTPTMATPHAEERKAPVHAVTTRNSASTSCDHRRRVLG